MSRRRLVLATLAVAALLSIVAVGGASAATVYRPTGGSFAEPGSGPGELFELNAVVVDDATGDILIASVSNPSAINVYVPEGGTAKFLESLQLPGGGSPEAMAIDETNRVLYVSNGSAAKIEKFAVGGSESLTLTPDPTFTSPDQGVEPGEIGSFNSPLAVDPSTGDLLVADTGNERVSRFSPIGSFVSSFDGADSTEGAFHKLSSIAVSATGAVYVVDIVRGDIAFDSGYSVLERFRPDGTADNAFTPALETPRTVAVDPNSGNVLVTTRSNGYYTETGTRFPPRLYTLKESQIIDELDFAPSEIGSATTGIAVKGGSAAYVYVTTSTAAGGGLNHAKVFESLPAADLTFAPPAKVGARTADLSGTVDPHGEPTTYQFVYSREGGPSLATEPQTFGEGGAPIPTTPTAIEGHLTGLEANSEYEVRLAATTGNATVSSRPQKFRTLRSAPEAVSGDAPNPMATSTTLNGSVDPFGEQTSYFFEYGTTTAYGARVPAHDVGIGAGRGPLRVSQELVGLNPDTTYHFRIVARNAAGGAVGQDKTFVTNSATLASRAYEMVSPVQKGEENANPNWMHSSPDGQSVTFIMRTAIPGLTGSGPAYPRYTAARSESGWHTVGLNPLTRPVEFFGGPYFADVLAVSEDGTKAVVTSTAVLATGASQDDTNLYLFDIATGTYQTIGTTPGAKTFAFWTHAFSGMQVVIGGTPNYSTVYFQTEGLPSAFLPGVSGPAVYEWSSAGLRLVAEEAESATLSPGLREPRMVSEDGSTVFYRTLSSELYVRIKGAGTFDISGPAVPAGIEYVGASADGSVFFYVNGEVLYRFDTVSQTSTVVAEQVGQSNAEFGVSKDGRYVYYVSNRDLFVWHDGASHLIQQQFNEFGTYKRVSENGRYLVFTSDQEIYRYDAVTEELACASCRTDGGKPQGRALPGDEPSLKTFFEFYASRSVSNTGEVFFDTPDPLVPADVNSSRDVYSFDGRHQTLISSGTSNADSRFGDATADGKNVYFTTSSRLVKADKDDNIDVYDARIGGGIPAQEVEGEGPGCSGAGCRVSVTPVSSAPPAIGSEALSGRKQSRAHRACPKGKRSTRRAGRKQCVKRIGKHKQGRAKKKRAKRNNGSGR